MENLIEAQRAYIAFLGQAIADAALGKSGCTEEEFQEGVRLRKAISDAETALKG